MIATVQWNYDIMIEDCLKQNYTPYRQIFKDYNILTLYSSYIPEVICFIKKHGFYDKKFGYP
jgi:hypothetical protein